MAWALSYLGNLDVRLTSSAKSKKSKGEDRIIASLEEQGLDVAAVRKHGEKVKRQLATKCWI